MSALPNEVSAEHEGEAALRAVFDAVNHRHNFKLEAGAGAGKTYSLIQALRHIILQRSTHLPRADQRVACLTYTKVARDEIRDRTDSSPYLFADTLHGFLWEMIAPYQKSLANLVLGSSEWESILDGRTEIDGLPVEYDLGIRGIGDAVHLHHNDIPKFAIELFAMPKFRALVADRFPIVFIDEYQDTPVGLIEAMLSGHETDRRPSMFGFFGDHWQQIYDATCGSIEHPSISEIDKHANFRSTTKIVSFLNQLRPELPQAATAGVGEGSVEIFHTNDWSGERLTHNWKGQISHQASHDVLQAVLANAVAKWGESGETKVLMLTHAALANELGYPSLPGIYKYNESFAKKEDEIVAFLVDVVGPALSEFEAKRFGKLFDVIGNSKPRLRSQNDKREWQNLFRQLIEFRDTGTVANVLDTLMAQNLFSVPSHLTRRHEDWLAAVAELSDGETLANRRLAEYGELRSVKYTEIVALAGYVDDSTIFSTKHNVKGAEFDNVVVVLGRGWAAYNFADMLLRFPRREQLEGKELASYQKSRNLFYVAVSRAKTNLVLLFTQELSDEALALLGDWVGESNVHSITSF